MSTGGPGTAQSIGFGAWPALRKQRSAGRTGLAQDSGRWCGQESPVSAGLAALESNLYWQHRKPQEGTTPLANPKTPRKRSSQDSKIRIGREGLRAGGVCSCLGDKLYLDGGPLGVRLDTEAPAGPGGMLSRTHRGWGYHELSGRDGVLKPNVSQARVHRAPEPEKGARARPDARFKSDGTANQGESQFRSQGHGQIQVQ